MKLKRPIEHRSGIGDYYDEEELGDDQYGYVLPIGVHELFDLERYLRVLDGFPTKSAPDEKFYYNNGGYAVLALIAQRAAGVPYPELLRDKVCAPAGLVDTAFLRSDELPDRTALGYLERDGLRTNVFHLPVVGGGDGGCYSTAADIRAVWTALFDGRVVAPSWLPELRRARGRLAEHPLGWGLVCWLRDDGTLLSQGSDPGVSYQSVYWPDSGNGYVVLGNTTDGAWPVRTGVDDLLRSLV